MFLRIVIISLLALLPIYHLNAEDQYGETEKLLSPEQLQKLPYSGWSTRELVKEAEQGNKQAALILAKSKWLIHFGATKPNSDEILGAKHWSNYWLNKIRDDQNPVVKLYRKLIEADQDFSSTEDIPEDIASLLNDCQELAKQGDIDAIQAIAFFLKPEQEVLQQWLEPLKKKASSGDHEAKAQLADLYIFGDLSDESILEKGIQYAKEAALAGNLSAMKTYGHALVLTFDGGGNEKEGFKYLKQAADMGHADAMHILLLTIRYGNEAADEQDMIKALCARGDLDMLISEGQRLIESGKAPLSGIKLLERAAEMNSYQALNLLALYYYDNKFYVPKNTEKSIEYSTKLANMDGAAGYLRLAAHYAEGIGENKDEAKAYNLIEKAVDKGLIDAYIEQARMMLKGAGTQSNPQKAFELLSQLKDDFSPPAKIHFLLGYMHETGSGTPVNYQLALEEYTLGAEADDTRAMNNLALMHEIGLGLTKDIDTAKKWYKKAADLGDDDAIVNLNRLEKSLGK